MYWYGTKEYQSSSEGHIDEESGSKRMFQYIRRLYRAHRKKLVFATGFAVVSYFVSVYVSSKIKEFQKQLKEENATRSLIKKRFSQTQKDCYMTFLSFLPVLIDPIFKELDVEDVTKQLRLIRKSRTATGEGKSELNSEDLVSSTKTETLASSGGAGDEKLSATREPGKSKADLWQELKTKSIVRFLTLVYSETLLIILLHLQLNIISRKSYLKTALKLAALNQPIQLTDLESEEGSDEEADRDLPEQAFLSFTWWLLNRGSMELKDIVAESVESVFNEINLRELLTMEQFGNLMFEVQKNIDSRLLERRADAGRFREKRGGDLAPLPSSPENSVPAIVSLMLPSSDDEFTLLQNTNTVEFLSAFNSHVSNMQTLQKMNGELKGYLASEQVGSLIRKIAAIGISCILQGVSNNLLSKQEPKDAGTESACPPPAEEHRWKLALIIAVLTPQTMELANRRIDNKVLYSMNNIEELDELSASVYSNFDLSTSAD